MVIKRNPPEKRSFVKRNPPEVKIFPKKGFGGHLPDPPEDCEKKKFWFFGHDRWWIDLGICHNCSMGPCEDRTTYLATLKRERDEYLANLPKKERKTK